MGVGGQIYRTQLGRGNVDIVYSCLLPTFTMEASRYYYNTSTGPQG
jgi:hypothetical protein